MNDPSQIDTQAVFARAKELRFEFQQNILIQAPSFNDNESLTFQSVLASANRAFEGLAIEYRILGVEWLLKTLREQKLKSDRKPKVQPI